MKDFIQIRATLDVLVETQEFLTDRLNWATDNCAQEECNASRYHVKNDEYFYRSEETGELEKTSKYDYDYAKEKYNTALKRVKAIQAVLDYMGGFKL